MADEANGEAARAGRGGEEGERNEDGEEGVPSVEIAKQRAFRQRLKQYETNEYGQPVPGTEAEFPFDASASDLGSASVGLGVYFSVLSVLLLLLGSMLALSIPTYARALKDSKFDNNHLIIASLPSDNYSSFCPRTDAAQSFLSIGTLGAFCSSETASRFSCPYICVIDTVNNENTNASAYRSKCSQENSNDPSCDAVTPCDGKSDGTCCCNISGLRYGQDRVPALASAMLFISQLAYIVWLVFYYYAFTTVSQSIQVGQVTASDYTIMVSNLPKTNIDRTTIGKFFSHFGIVRNVALPIRIGNYLLKEQELSRLQIQLHEAWSAAKQRARRGATNITTFERLMERLYDIYMHGTLSLGKDDADKIQAKIQSLKKEIQEAEQAGTQFIGKALVTFDYEKHKVNALLDQRAGMFDQFIRCQGTGARFRNRNLKVSVAPEPSDIWHENADYSDFARGLRSIVSLLSLSAVLLIGGVIQFYLERERVRAHRDTLTAEGSKETQTQNEYRGIAFATGIVVTLINFIFVYMVKWLTNFEKPLTRSSYEATLVVRLSIAQLLNAITPIFVIAPKNLYNSGGLAEQAVYIQLLAGIAPDVYNLIDPDRFLRRYIFPRVVSTQQQMDELFAPNEFVLAEHYAAVIKTVGLALLFGPMSPLSYLIGFMGIVLTYLVDKYVAIKRARVPRRLTSDNAYSVYNLLWVLGLAQILISGLVYLQSRPYDPTLWIIALVLYLIAMILPLPRMLGIARDAALEDGGSQGKPYSGMLRGDASSGLDQHTDKKQDEYQFPLSEEYKDFDLVAPPNSVHPAYFSEVYAVVPEYASAEFLERIVQNFKLFSEPIPADQSLLPRQKPHTGGHNATKEAAEAAAQSDKAKQQQQMAHIQRALPGAFAQRVDRPQHQHRTPGPNEQPYIPQFCYDPQQHQQGQPPMAHPPPPYGYQQPNPQWAPPYVQYQQPPPPPQVHPEQQYGQRGRPPPPQPPQPNNPYGRSGAFGR